MHNSDARTRQEEGVKEKEEAQEQGEGRGQQKGEEEDEEEDAKHEGVNRRRADLAETTEGPIKPLFRKLEGSGAVSATPVGRHDRCFGPATSSTRWHHHRRADCSHRPRPCLLVCRRWRGETECSGRAAAQGGGGSSVAHKGGDGPSGPISAARPKRSHLVQGELARLQVVG